MQPICLYDEGLEVDVGSMEDILYIISQLAGFALQFNDVLHLLNLSKYITHFPYELTKYSFLLILPNKLISLPFWE